jgi:hypothetical protein
MSSCVAFSRWPNLLYLRVSSSFDGDSKKHPLQIVQPSCARNLECLLDPVELYSVVFIYSFTSRRLLHVLLPLIIPSSLTPTAKMGFYFDPVFDHHILMEDTPGLEKAIQMANLQNTWIFYCYVGLIILVFSLLRIWRRVYVLNRRLRYGVGFITRFARFVRQWCIRKAFWPFTTRGHMLVILGYILINLYFCLMSPGKNLLVLQLARRTGW